MPSFSGSCGEDVGDIEDCVLPGDPTPSDRIRAENKVLPRALRRKVRTTTSLRDSDTSGKKTLQLKEEDVPSCESFVPGTHSVYIKTWGCSHNNSDGEYMAGLLGASGYSITSMYSSRVLSLVHRISLTMEKEGRREYNLKLYVYIHSYMTKV